MADVKFKFIADDSEVRKKLNNLLKIRDALSKDFTAKMDKGNVGGLIASLKEATKEANKLGGALNKGSLNPANAQLIASLVEKKKAIEDERLAQSKLRTQALEDAKLMREAKMKEIDLIRKAREERQKEVVDNKVKREAAKQAKDEAKALADLAREEAKVAKEKAKRKKQLEQENSEYYKLNKALGTVRKETKDLLAEMFRMERQGHKNTLGYQKLKEKADALTKQTQFLDRGIKKIDATLGLHQRNVGNYGSALEEISPIVSEINRKLALFGTSIDELAGKPGAIKELGAAFISMGKGIMGFLLSPVGLLITAIASLFMLFQRNKRTVMEFEAGLRDISKTTGIAGQALRDLGKDIVDMSRKLQVVDAKKLNEYATAAGQLGVKGRANILAFTESLAMLETASDISGEQGAKEIARLLTLVEGGVQNVKLFGDEIVNLGNNFAASESEILSNAEAISQNVGQYRMGRQHVLAYATATKSLGIEAEVVGSTFQKTLGTFEKSIRTGKGVADILKVVGGSAAELQKRFREDASGVFQDYIKGLNAIHKAGGSVNAQMEKNSIVDIRQRRVIGTLAVGYDTLARAMNTVKDAAGAMQEEFENGANKLVNQTERIGIAWDNLVLSIEDGQGAIGKTSVAVVGFFADMLEGITNVVKSDSWKEFFTRINPQNWGHGDAINRAKQLKEVYKEIADFLPGERVSEERIKIAVDNGYDFTTMVKESHEAYGKMLEAYKEYQYRVTNNMMAEDERTVAHYEKLADDAKAYYDTLISAGKKYNYEIKKDAPTGTNTEEDAEIDEKAKRAAERATEQRRQAIERQRSLQLQIDGINEKSLRGQLSRDEQEVASIREKYSKIREEVRKFYADPKNKGLKVNMSGIAQAEDFEISEATTRQGTVKLLEQLNEQKAIYDEYNNYVSSNSVEEAEQMYADQIEIVKDFKERLKKEYMDIITLEQTAADGAFTGSSVKLTQAQEERAKALKTLLDALDKDEQRRDRDNYASLLKQYQTFSQKREQLIKRAQKNISDLEAKGDKERANRARELHEEELKQLFVEEIESSSRYKKVMEDIDKSSKWLLTSAYSRGRDAVMSMIDGMKDATSQQKNMLKKLFGNWFDQGEKAANEGRYDAVVALVNDFDQLVGMANQFDGSMANSLKTVGNMVSQVASMTKMLSDTLSSTGQGLTKSGSGVVAIIGAVLSVVGGVMEMFEASAKQREIDKQYSLDHQMKQMDAVTRALEYQLQIIQDIYGTDRVRAYSRVVEESSAKFKQSTNELANQQKYTLSGDREIDDIVRAFNAGEDIGKARRQMLSVWESRGVISQLKIGFTTVQNITQEQLADLYNMINDASLDEATRNQVQNIIDQYEIWRDALNQMREEVTGISFKSLTDGIVDMFAQGKVSAKDFSEFFEKQMQQAILRGFSRDAIEKQMQPWYELFAKYSEDGLTQSEIEKLRNDYMAIMQNAEKSWEDLKNVTGIDFSTDAQKENIQGRINRNMSESTGSDILGFERARYAMAEKSYNLGVIQISNQQKYITIANDKLVALNAIQMNTANTVQRLDTAVVHLQQIVRNTGGTTGRTAEGMGL